MLRCMTVECCRNSQRAKNDLNLFMLGTTRASGNRFQSQPSGVSSPGHSNVPEYLRCFRQGIQRSARPKRRSTCKTTTRRTRKSKVTGLQVASLLEASSLWWRWPDASVQLRVLVAAARIVAEECGRGRSRDCCRVEVWPA